MTGPASGHATIFAQSSGSVPAAIAVVRISGPGAAGALAILAGRLPEPRHATAVRLSTAEGDLLDRALVLWLPRPGTATGEDLAELHLHGGRATVAAVLGALGTLPGLRGAEPGEFTRRALVNGRLDLTQVEGLADLLAAETEGQRRAALRSAEGGLGQLVVGWRERLLGLAASIEAAIDYADEHDDVEVSLASIRVEAAGLHGEITAMLDQPPAERLRDGVRIVIAGPVNAGKSTLLNALVQREAAIASPVAGTTRDLLEVPVMFHGTACIFLDGAGLRETDDPVEQIGIARITAAIDHADILIWLGAASECPSHSHRIIVHAQADRTDRSDLTPGVDLAVSAHTGRGLDQLLAIIRAHVATLLPTQDGLALNVRQRSLLGETAAHLAEVERFDDELLIAEAVRGARLALDRLVGSAATEDMLDALFGRFCVGK